MQSTVDLMKYLQIGSAVFLILLMSACAPSTLDPANRELSFLAGDKIFLSIPPGAHSLHTYARFPYCQPDSGAPTTWRDGFIEIPSWNDQGTMEHPAVNKLILTTSDFATVVAYYDGEATADGWTSSMPINGNHVEQWMKRFGKYIAIFQLLPSCGQQDAFLLEAWIS